MKRAPWMLTAAGLALAPALSPANAAEPKPAASPSPSAMHANPFLQPSTLPYQLPPFDKITDADFRPAFDQGMAEQRKEIDAIAHDPEAPTFENTIVAMERTGALLTRVEKAFGNLVVSNSTEEMEKIEAEMSPKLAAHEDAILLDPALFARVDAVWQKRDSLGLDAESLQLLNRYETMFLRAGAKLSEKDKTELKKLNEDISSLMTQFRQNVLKATKDGAVVVDNKADLDGFSAEQIGAAAEA
ncbi:MAG TPA: dipeptidyl carboxypeptidase II, partial [bacterium]|nr:dipeptidyl carboxypeptidase II [bacterium]